MTQEDLVVGEIYWLRGIGPLRYGGLWGQICPKGTSPVGHGSLSFVNVLNKHDYDAVTGGYAASLSQVEERVSAKTPWLAEFRKNSVARGVDVAEIDYILAGGRDVRRRCRSWRTTNHWSLRCTTASCAC